MTIGFFGDRLGEAARATNKADSGQTLSWNPLEYHRVPEGARRPQSFTWSTVGLTLEEATHLSRQAGVEAQPWRKVTVLWIDRDDAFDQPGPPEVVFWLQMYDKKGSVAVGTTSHRVKHHTNSLAELLAHSDGQNATSMAIL